MAAAAAIPSSMRSLVAPKQCKPDEYEILEMPTPVISLPTQVLVRVRTASIQTGDVQTVSGQLKAIYLPEYPAKLGTQGAGIVAAIGSDVQHLQVGDEVYGIHFDKPAFRNEPTGFASEYAITEERFLLAKPAHVSFEDATAAIGSVVTAYQSIKRGLALTGQDSLEGKTVYVPGGLSSTGSVGAQVAKNVFGASKMITTVSTSKLPLLEQYLPGIFDQVIDYTKEKVADSVPRGSVDFVYNTQWGSSLDDGIATVNPESGAIISITGVPSKRTVKELVGEDRFTWFFRVVLTLAEWYYSWKLRGTRIKYEMVSGSPHIREDLEKAGEIIALGKVRPVITVVDLNDLPKVREECSKVLTGKGGLGRLVVRIS